MLIPALSITATAGVSTITPGGTVPYTLTLSNTGQTAYTATSVTLALAAALDDATYNNNAAASAGSVVYNAGPGTLVWTGDIAIGAVVTITGSVTVRNPDPADKTLTAVASSAAAGSTCPVGSSNPACTSTVAVKVPALTITQAANVSTTTPGSVVQHTVTVTNTGQTAYTGATFTESLTGMLDDATYTSASATIGSVSFASPTLTWTGDLAIGATATILFSVTVTDPDTGNKTLTGTVTSPTAGSNCATGSGDARCTSSVTVLIPGLTIATSTDAGGSTTPGSVVKYTIYREQHRSDHVHQRRDSHRFHGYLRRCDLQQQRLDHRRQSGGQRRRQCGLGAEPCARARAQRAQTSFTVNNPPTGNKLMPTIVSSNAPGSTCPTSSTNPDCRTDTTVLIPGLTFTKTANVASVVTGGTVNYSIARHQQRTNQLCQQRVSPIRWPAC